MLSCSQKKNNKLANGYTKVPLSHATRFMSNEARYILHINGNTNEIQSTNVLVMCVQSRPSLVNYMRKRSVLDVPLVTLPTIKQKQTYSHIR